MKETYDVDHNGLGRRRPSPGCAGRAQQVHEELQGCPSSREVLMDSILNMPTAERRKHQLEVGLSLQEALPQPRHEEVTNMHTNTTQRTPAKHGAPTTDPAVAAVENIARSLEMTPTFKEIALHELKRAAVYVPLILGSGLTLLWARRRFFV